MAAAAALLQAPRTVEANAADLREVAQRVAAQLRGTQLKVDVSAPDMGGFSLFEDVAASDKEELLRLARGHPRASRAMGALVGMAVCDSIGHAFEFLPVSTPGCSFDAETLEVRGDFYQVLTGMGREGGFSAKSLLDPSERLGKFQLRPLQWTDDTSMGLCCADSLLVCKGYKGSDMRVRFWNWWNRNYNNAFRFDEARSGSVGLGGNISASLDDIWSVQPTPRYEADAEDAGNGSLMRLAALPVYFHMDEELAALMSAESSYTTHPGAIAADACSFLGFAITRALARPAGDEGSAAQFLDSCIEVYLARPRAAENAPLLARLLRSEEPCDGPEGCWRWRESEYRPLLLRSLKARGSQYNGYPVSSGYFGAYSMDGLAMALNSFYHSKTYMEALGKVIGLLGDADSTGSICGQLAGAFYGFDAIDSRLVERLGQWDNSEIAMRGALLYALGAQLGVEAQERARAHCGPRRASVFGGGNADAEGHSVVADKPASETQDESRVGKQRVRRRPAGAVPQDGDSAPPGAKRTRV